MYRCGIITNESKIDGRNFKTKAQCEEWVLSQDNIKKAVIMNKENINDREIINF